MEPENCSPFFYRCRLKASLVKPADGMTERKGAAISNMASVAGENGVDSAGQKQERPELPERPGTGVIDKD